MCMTKAYMFLSCVVPGPFNPMVGIDIFLQPLIDDLKKLWSDVHLRCFKKAKFHDEGNFDVNY